LHPANFDTWHETGGHHNPTLASQRQALEATRFEAERNRTGHLSKASAYASVRQNQSVSGNTYNQRYDTNTIGIEVSVPLYTTRRDLARGRYDYLMAWTQLHYYAGTLREEDLAKVDEAFMPREATR
jgi:outer membrane protein TolC